MSVGGGGTRRDGAVLATVYVLEVSLAAVLAACSMRDGVLGRLTDADRPVDEPSTPDAAWVPDSNRTHDGPAASDGARRPDGEPASDSPTIPASSCALTSPRVTLAGQKTCTGRLASARFSNSLCVCNNLELGNALTTHGFDSRQGPYQAGQADDSGGSVAINGNYSSLAGGTDVSGSLSIAGTGDVRFVGVLKVRGDLFAAGNISAAGFTTVSRNAWLAGNYTGLGPFTVIGDLHHAGTLLALPVSATTNRKEPVTVLPACPCAAADILDVAAVVDAAKLDNDNARLAVAPSALASVQGVTRWKLGCGRAYLSQIGGMGSLVVEVAGPAALFIDGSIDFTGALAFELAPGAEVDVWVKGDLGVRGTISLSSKDHPAAGRIWIGGSQPITLAPPFVGNLYAPRASVTAIAGLEVWGSLFTSALSGLAFANIYYDRAVTETGANCDAPRPAAGLCTRCTWCSGGAACVGGQCGPCQTDGDCCGLSVCASGYCVPIFEAHE